MNTCVFLGERWRYQRVLPDDARILLMSVFSRRERTRRKYSCSCEAESQHAHSQRPMHALAFAHSCIEMSAVQDMSLKQSTGLKLSLYPVSLCWTFGMGDSSL